MFNNIKKLFVCVGILASIFSINSFAEVKEVQTLDDFAAEVLETKPKEKVKEKIQEKTTELTGNLLKKYTFLFKYKWNLTRQ